MTLADQIIEHGPWTRSDPIPGHLRIMMSDGLNELRDELLELQQLRAAAQTLGRYVIYAPPYRSGGKTVLGITHDGCPSKWWDEVGDFTALAELVRRADQHTQDCP